MPAAFVIHRTAVLEKVKILCFCIEFVRALVRCGLACKIVDCRNKLLKPDIYGSFINLSVSGNIVNDITAILRAFLSVLESAPPA